MQEREFEVGTHTARVVEHSLEWSKTGKGYVSVTFGDDAGRRIEWRGYLTPAAKRLTEDALAALGWHVASDDVKVSALLESQHLVGVKAQIVVADEQHLNTTQRVVKFVNPAGSGRRMTADEAKRFDDGFKKKPESPRGPDPTAKDKGTDDSIPF